MFSAKHVFTREDFFQFLDLEIRRAQRYQNFFSVMKLELPRKRTTAANNQLKTLKALVKLLREEIRETDVIGQTNKSEIMILLPYCDSSGADVVNRRLSSLVEDFHFGEEGLQVKFGLISFPVQANDMAEILYRLNERPQDAAVSGAH